MGCSTRCSDDPYTVAPGIRQIEGIRGMAPGLVGVRICGGDAVGGYIRPHEVLAYLYAEVAGIPATIGEHRSRLVNDLIDVVGLGPGVSPPVGRFRLSVPIVLIVSRHAVIELIGAVGRT